MTKKNIAVVAAVILAIGISAGTILLVGKKAVPVATEVENGLSAYELAVQFGYEGTVQEWLESLEGKSAYQIAVDSGYKGTESQWLASLKATSDNTANIKNAQFNSKGELILTFSDDTTINLGVAVGANGKDGVSISEASINDEGQLILTFTDGKSFNLDNVVGSKGEAGVGIVNSTINGQGELVLTYTNGQEANLGKVIGADGQDGANGKDGIDAIVSTVINNSGELVITYSNGTSDNLGVVVGRDGKDGADGKDGVNGTNGKDGVDGKDGIGVSSAQITTSGELVLTYSNGQSSNLGKVIGADGKDGQNGADGKDGVNGTNGKDGVDGKDGISIAKSEINSKGELVITYSNNEVENLGVVVGSKGVDGKDGQNGADGKDGKDGVAGKDGVGIEDIKIVNGNLSITLTNGTTMDLGNIKGADGKDGVNGADGKDGKDGVNGADGKNGISVSGAEINAANELVLTFSDGTDKNLGVVVGKDGANGVDGADGTNGTDGRGIKKTEINALGELVITYTDDETDNLGVIISDNGGVGTGAIAPRVQINASTNEWEISTDGGKTYTSTGVKATGADGKDGVNGEDGKDGQNGISITEASINDKNELILTFSDGNNKNLGVIVGADGKDGKNGENGKDGQNGADGKDGINGADGKDGQDGVGISGASIDTNDHLILALSDGNTIDVGVVVGADGKDGQNGANGKDGINGTNGVDGKDGVGIKNVTVSDDGILTVTLDNDTIFTLGNIKGKDGVGIAKTEINSEGKLVITYTDSKVVILDKVVGNDGVGIKSAEITEDYMLKLVFTDNGTQTLGPIRGEKGADGVGIKSVSVGDDGYLYVTYSNSDEAQKIAYIKGDKGDKGDAGADGKTPYIKNGTWWIGDSDTGIAATGADGSDGKAGVSVANSYVDENLHLWIVLSDGTKIDAGYVGVTTGGDSTNTTHTVVFKDYDGTILKTEEVESGKSATAPASPTREGFDFAGWDTDFSNVTASIVVTAKYTENSKPTIQVSNVTASAGATIQVPVVIKNNPGIAGATITLTYDSELTLTSADNGDAFSALTCSKPGKFVSPCNFTWDSESGETKENGTILYLTFTVPSTASAGDVFEISCSYRDGDIFNDAMDDVTLTTISGGITVN